MRTSPRPPRGLPRGRPTAEHGQPRRLDGGRSAARVQTVRTPPPSHRGGAVELKAAVGPPRGRASPGRGEARTSPSVQGRLWDTFGTQNISRCPRRTTTAGRRARQYVQVTADVHHAPPQRRGSPRVRGVVPEVTRPADLGAGAADPLRVARSVTAARRHGQRRGGAGGTAGRRQGRSAGRRWQR